MVWPRGRICPACGYRRSTALAGRDLGRQALPGLYQCSDGDGRFQFTMTMRTPLHSTKLCSCGSGYTVELQHRLGREFVRLGSESHSVFGLLCKEDPISARGLPIRDDLTPEALRRLARRERDRPAAGRMFALANALEGIGKLTADGARAGVAQG